jgi:hypothetical protein
VVGLGAIRPGIAKLLGERTGQATRDCAAWDRPDGWLLARLIPERTRSTPGAAKIGAVDYEHLPGGDLVAKGVEDLAGSRETVEALLVSIAAPRLRELGVPVATPLLDPEHRLYELLAKGDADSAHSRYNALLRRLVSFESAQECVG